MNTISSMKYSDVKVELEKILLETKSMMYPQDMRITMEVARREEALEKAIYMCDNFIEIFE